MQKGNFLVLNLLKLKKKPKHEMTLIKQGVKFWGLELKSLFPFLQSWLIFK